MSEAQSYEELTHGHNPWSHRRKSLARGLALARLVFPKVLESRVVSNSNLQVTSKGPVCHLFLCLLKAQRANSVQGT
jgi:hypothetical protein